MSRQRTYQSNTLNSAILVIATFMVWMSSFTPIYQKIDSWLLDVTQYHAANEHYFDDVLVIDINDSSLNELTPYFGVWPYKRDDYSLVLDYLYELGAETVVFDILFVDKRPDDNVLADTMDKYPSTVIVGGATKFISKKHHEAVAKEALYKKLDWQLLNQQTPTRSVPNILLPQATYFAEDAQDTNVGIVTVSVDDDGILRKMPLLFSVGEHRLPSLPLSTIRANSGKSKTIDYDKSNQTLTYHQYQWPVDEDGNAHLYYPKNANAVLSLSFHDVVQPALGVSEKKFSAELFRGKTVFIGSTAIQSDIVNTPRGLMGGTYLLSIAYQNLKHDLLLQPNKFWLDALLYLIAITPALIIISRKQFLFRKDSSIALLTLITIVSVNIVAFSHLSQKTVLLFPILILFLSGAMYVFKNSVLTKLQNVELNRLMEELTESNRQLEIAATTDSLTGLFNRRAFLSSLTSEIDRFKRSGTPFTVAIMDLDHFKQVNDTYGHQVGDDVIVLFSSIIQRFSRQSDVAGRWGGEEFVMLLPNTDVSSAMNFFERLRLETESTEVTSAPKCKITVSIGLINGSAKENGEDELISHADDALYEAKRTGRNKICTYEELPTTI